MDKENLENHFSPNDIHDWEIFLIDILDGEYDTDIRKIGSSVSFIQNQLSLCNKYFRHETYLKTGIKNLINNYNFTTEFAIKNNSQCLELLNWASYFLFNEKTITDKCLSLFNRLINFDFNSISNFSKKQLLALQEISGETLLKILKTNKSIDFNQDSSILEQFQTSIELETNWSDWLCEENSNRNLIGSIGLIYLQKWKVIDKNIRQQFLRSINSSLVLKKDVFFSILADMTKTPINYKVDYLYFMNDCLNLENELYDLIVDFAPQWKDAHRWENIIEIEGINVTIQKKNLLGEYTKNLTFLTSGSFEKINEKDGFLN